MLMVGANDWSVAWISVMGLNVMVVRKPAQWVPPFRKLLIDALREGRMARVCTIAEAVLHLGPLFGHAITVKQVARD